MIPHKLRRKLIGGLFLFAALGGCFLSHFIYGQQSQSIAEGGPELINAKVGSVRAFHKAADTLLFSTEKGLYRWNDELKGNPELVYTVVGKVFTSLLSGDTLFVGADSGLYRWNNKLEGQPKLIETGIGAPRGLYGLGDVLLICTEKGLYRWNNKLEGQPELLDETVRDAYDFQRMGDALLIVGRSGFLYRWNIRLEGKPELVNTEPIGIGDIHQIRNTLLLGTSKGLYKWNDKLEGQPELLYPMPGGVVALHQVGNTLLISTQKGVYKWNDELEGQPKPIDTSMDTVFAFHQADNAVLAGAINGLYRWDNRPDARPELVDAAMGTVMHFYQVDNDILIEAEKGVYRWNSNLDGKPLLVSDTTGYFFYFNQLGSTLLISAEGGLYRWNNKLNGKPELINADIGTIRSFHPTGDTLLLGTERGLYQWNDKLEGQPKFVDAVAKDGVTSFHQAGEALLIGTPEGVIDWHATAGRNEPQGSEMGSVLTFYQKDDVLLICTEKGLYRWNNKLEGQPELLDTSIKGILAIHKVKESLMVGTAGGLYRWNEKLEGRPELIDSEMGAVSAFQQVGSVLLVGAQSGLLKIDGVGTKWNASIAVDLLPGRILSDDNVTIKWVIKNYEHRANPQNVRVRLIVKDQRGAIVSKDAAGNNITQNQWIVPAGQHQLTIPNLSPGNYSLIVLAIDLTGNSSESEPINFKVYSSLEEYLLDWGRLLALLYAAGNIILFLILVLGARRSKRCFDILTDPVMRKLGIYFGFALRYVKPVRIWVFERYFDELKKEWSAVNVYVPYHLIPSNDKLGGTTAELIESTEISKRIRQEPQVLILGGPGTGKSALVKNLMQMYCQEASLRVAVAKYGFIPIWVKLRELARIEGVKVSELARAAMEGKEMTFDRGDSFFESLLRNGDFLIVMDGLNEVNIENSVYEFAATYPSVRLLTTSQANLVSESFKRYKLPFFDPEFAKTLLRKFIGKEEAEKAINEAPTLWGDIKCGYDVRLVEYVIQSSKKSEQKPSTLGKGITHLPTNRLELYRAMIEFSKEIYKQYGIQEKPFPYARICEHAWNMWRNGRYIFKEAKEDDKGLTRTEIEHLVETNLVIRTPEGYEFMHSLMRDFLSAEFCTRHSGPIKSMIEKRLEGRYGDTIWKLPPADQFPVFSFLTESIDKVEDLQAIYQFASDNIKERYELMIAVQQAANKKEWQIKVNINIEL